MRKRFFRLSQCAALALLLAACAGESNLPTANGTATFNMINAIATSPSIALLIEERGVGSADYQGAMAPEEFDNLKYKFNFEAFLAGNTTRTRLANMDVDTQRDKAYTFLVSGQLATPTITLWERDRREWAGTETEFDARFAHTAATLGPVDVYFQMPGVAPAAGQEVGTLAFTEILPTVSYPAGDYVLIFTTAGDPNDILFTSNTLAPAAAAGSTFAVFDGDANDLGPIAVRQILDTGSNANIVDENSTPTVRFFHATPNLATADVYTDELLADQILADHMYRDVTADLPLAAGATALTYTMAGNVGAVLHEQSINLVPGNRYNFFIVGEVDMLQGISQLPDRRPVETLVKFNFVHTDTNHDAVDLYVVTAGSDIADLSPHMSNITIGAPPSNSSLQAGDFELYLTPNGEKTVLAGPIALSPALGDIVTFVSYNNVDPAVSDLVLIPLP